MKTRLPSIAKIVSASSASTIGATSCATATPALRARINARNRFASSKVTKRNVASSPSPPPVSNLTSLSPIMRASGFCSMLTS